jgi:hypothetical protein
MRRVLFTFLSGALVALAASVAAAGPLRTDHPIIGTWKIELPDGSCHEVYHIRRDGTMVVTSAEEISESAFTISDRPSAKGFYKWIDRVTKDNGKRDCSGDVTEVGHSATNFVLFNPAQDQFVICEDDSGEVCIGPFVRLKGNDI